MNPKIRNAIAELVSLAGIVYAAIPSLDIPNIPRWLGPVLSLVVTVGNQWLKDSTPPPTPTAPTVTITGSGVAPTSVTTTTPSNSNGAS